MTCRHYARPLRHPSEFILYEKMKHKHNYLTPARNLLPPIHLPRCGFTSRPWYKAQTFDVSGSDRQESSLEYVWKRGTLPTRVNPETRGYDENADRGEMSVKRVQVGRR